MPSILKLTLEYFLLNTLILTIAFLGGPFIRSRWPDWWERWVVASYPDEFETSDDYPRI